MATFHLILLPSKHMDSCALHGKEVVLAIGHQDATALQCCVRFCSITDVRSHASQRSPAYKCNVCPCFLLWFAVNSRFFHHARFIFVGPEPVKTGSVLIRLPWKDCFLFFGFNKSTRSRQQCLYRKVQCQNCSVQWKVLCVSARAQQMPFFLRKRDSCFAVYSVWFAFPISFPFFYFH